MNMEDLAHRLERLETRHDVGGACDNNRTETWKEIGKIRERITALEVKLLIGGAVVSVLGPMLANWISKKL